ncbi:hypothetical protein [Pseudomonas sp. TH31]|uniref:hypothetical protein n=1 Tax=Pseudomonas sp. TH31 TaxID=2796396 RepID=UPI0019135B83|nr:hypothetical protein [Pseudomonas sp. TH31]MBK5415788.1 hypothetical protein [Pseudomonas sp. TH31]
MRIPEVLVLSLHPSATGLRTGIDYLYLQGPYGPELLKLSAYQQLIKTPASTTTICRHAPC